MSIFTVCAENACVACGEVHRFELDSGYALAFQQGFILWHDRGVLIQDALPFLTAGQREILMTGVSEECWDALFADEDEDLGDE
jgi:hypothetical protein